MATGFYRNADLGLPPFGGMSFVFSARTGMPEAVLLDGGHLTNVRTAAAGAVAARHLAPREVRAIGICGSGVQARLQAEHLKAVTPCRDVIVVGARSRQGEAMRRRSRPYRVSCTYSGERCGTRGGGQSHRDHDGLAHAVSCGR